MQKAKKAKRRRVRKRRKAKLLSPPPPQSVPKPKLTVMVSSSVYGKEPLLEQIYAFLTTYGYNVLMSYKGTVPVIPGKSAFDSCIAAVETCDLFFSLITPDYGSGILGEGVPSITHRELLKAIELKKPRWIVAHEHVVLSRRVLADVGFKTVTERATLKLRKGAQIIDDLRVIDMYEAATCEELPLQDRKDNWVQPYRMSDDALRYLQVQFSGYSDMERFVEDWRQGKVAPP
jgi:hypothetical protein